MYTRVLDDHRRRREMGWAHAHAADVPLHLTSSFLMPDEAQQVHLRMRAPRSKSESHMRAFCAAERCIGVWVWVCSASGGEREMINRRKQTRLRVEGFWDEQRMVCSQDDNRSPNRLLPLRGRVRAGAHQRPCNCTVP
ncbi:hypothetical protein FIBSPDRAFT_465915 [Athelia psychrophila]|uniref:Uncharacterized protein n=1 Tax=Athelia psychrophila TaxID=1759441 RepID=A0A166LJB0_9AGAM|nr:hypothetical protein FIBSPDRAFT_465915 [Fibularhizoctonia sp. CBS 109695]